MSFTKLDDNLAEFGDIVSWELAKALRANIDALYASVPVGEICPILTDVPGVEIDPNIWQECNGTAITLATSPLRGTESTPRLTPDMSDRYMKVPSADPVGTYGGFNTFNGFGHNHGGVTGVHDAPQGADWSDSGDAQYNVAAHHAHGIPWQTVGDENMEPRYYTLKFFIKIQ